jgi:hypothetical protein
MSLPRSFVSASMLAMLIACALAAATAQPANTPAASPSSLPSNVATPSALFSNRAYFYRGEPSDPKVHPIPAEVQSGFKRDNRIYCLDWSRKLRAKHADVWSYFVTKS